MAHAAGQSHHLRLVGTDSSAAAWRNDGDAAAAIVSENRRAAANPELQTTDPRWALAVRAYSQLQGSTLTPERRQRVMQTAKQLGVRQFDANVIIAIVQDSARSGRSLNDAAPTLQLLDTPDPATTQSAEPTRWLAALVLAAAVNLLLMWWLLA